MEPGVTTILMLVQVATLVSVVFSIYFSATGRIEKKIQTLEERLDSWCRRIESSIAKIETRLVKVELITGLSEDSRD